MRRVPNAKLNRGGNQSPWTASAPLTTAQALTAEERESTHLIDMSDWQSRYMSNAYTKMGNPQTAHSMIQLIDISNQAGLAGGVVAAVLI